MWFTPSDQRIVVIGTSGSGKTTFGRRLAALFGAPFIELDQLFWGRDWTPVDNALFRERVERDTSGERWVCDGNYGQVREIIWGRATTVIWLRYSYARTLRQVVTRTVRRSVTGEQICGENRESLLRGFLRRDSIILWMMTTWGKHRRTIPELMEQPHHAHLRFVVCRSPRETEALLQAAHSMHSKST